VNIERKSLSDTHKEAVKSWVPKLRKELETDFTAQLRRLGLRPDGKHQPLDKMPLSDADKAVRERVEALLNRDTLAEGTPQRGWDNVIRELTYTLLNRLVGLKSMEARKLLFLPTPGKSGAESELTEIITPISDQARSRYLRDFREAGGERYKYEQDAEESLLRDALTAAFRHITTEIRILFDPEHEYACVWPTHACLVKVIGLLNSELPEDAFKAVDFLGWVYQFFNRDEKKKVRDENKGTPRSSYELSVINQFYTPSWVVKTLVDNTLGRLWLQMHPDSSLKPQGPPPLPDERVSDEPVADYLVPRTGEKIRYQRVTEEGRIETFKLARDIALLDPACGTMHFGQYAFGLFYQMYLDEIENAGKEGWPSEPSVKNKKDIPAAIIENNIFGIDIDPRAIQIATLSLLLTAKESARQHGFSPEDVHVRRTNLVVANTVDLGQEQLTHLIENLNKKFGDSKLQERLIKTLWENLQYTGELGALVQVSESVSRVLDDWIEERGRAKGMTKLFDERKLKQLDLESIVAEGDRAVAEQLVLERRLMQQEAEELKNELLAAVENAATTNGKDPASRLFYEDTARGLKLLDILSHRFDAIVMNPPYGSFVPKIRELIRKLYPLSYNDIYAAFIDRATQLIEPYGYVGALVSSTFVTLTTFEKLRTEILLKRNPLLVMLDLGFGILDGATVETAAIVLKGGTI